MNSGVQSQEPLPKHLPLFLQGSGLHLSRLQLPASRLDWNRGAAKSSISPFTITFLKHPLNPGRLEINGGRSMFPGGTVPRKSGPLRSREVLL